MAFKRLFLFSLFLVFLFSRESRVYGETGGIELMVHYEQGFFNRVYIQHQYRKNREDTFPVSLKNWGGELKYRNRSGEVRGAGIVMSRISGGSLYNYDHYEKQPEMLFSMPYFFIGYDFDWWALETGLGCFLTWIESQPLTYYQPDGTEKQVTGGGMRFARDESFTLLNMMVRLLRKDMPHIRLKLGRERFNLVDSLFNLAFVLPVNDHEFELYISFPTDIFPSMPKCSRRYGINYSYRMGKVLMGLTAGYLAYNEKGGGDGNMNVLEPANFSLGAFSGVRL